MRLFLWISNTVQVLNWSFSSFAMKCESSIGEMNQKNVYGDSLELCSLDPCTGWFRDGYARTDSNDQGTHVACATMTQEVQKGHKKFRKTISIFFSVLGLYQESRQRFIYSSPTRISRIEAGWPLGHLHFALAWSPKGRICSTIEIKGHKPKSLGIRGFGTFGRIWRQQILTKIKKIDMKKFDKLW